MTSQTLVITGASGFVGGHLATLAAAAGNRVIALGREATPSSLLADVVDDYIAGDLTASWPVTRHAGAVIHLAGLAAVGPSFDEPQRYLDVNSSMVTAMFEHLVKARADTRVLVVSSGSVYAPSHDELPITESAPTVPTSPYAVSKLLVETQAAYYRGRGLDVAVARPFNHIGPGQGPGFLIPDLTRAMSALGPDAPMHVGNLTTARDYTDVRDVAAAYLSIVSAPRRSSFVYNVASGSSHTGLEVLEVVASALDRPVPELVVDTSRFRPGDVASITGDASRLRTEFGWSPTIDWADSVRDSVRSTPL